MNKKLFTKPIVIFLLLLSSSGCFSKQSKESLHALIVINIGLLQEKASLEMNNDNQIAEFMSQVVLNPKNDRIKKQHDQAIVVAKLSKEVNDFIEKMKVELVMNTDGVDETKANERVNNPFMVEKKSNFRRTTHFFGTNSPPGDQGKAHELKTKLMDLKMFLLKFVESNDQSSMEKKLNLLDLSDGEEVNKTGTWEMFHFYHLPLSAALTELTRWQVIVRQVENVMLNYLKSGPTTNSMKFDAIEAIIVPDSTVVTAGSTFEADIFLSAYSTTAHPKITYGSSVDERGFVGGGIVLNDDKFTNGKGHISVPASGLGERTCEGTITVIHPVTGEEIFYPFKTRYQVISKKTRGQFRIN